MRKLMTVVLASAGLTLIAGTAAVGIITATATPSPAPVESAETRVMVDGENAGDGGDAEISVKREPAPAPDAAPVPVPGATPATEKVVAFEYALNADEQAIVDESNSFHPDAIFPEELHLAIGALQDRIITKCMTAYGFDYDTYLTVTRADGEKAPTQLEEWIRTGVDSTAFFLALYGEQTNEPYDWTRAGCHGYAVHITGMDDQH